MTDEGRGTGMDTVDLGAGVSPEAAVVTSRPIIFQPRMKTFQELLRQTQKLSKPRPSPVLADNVRMRGPSVEECQSCRNFIGEADLQHCSACDRAFHFTCLPPGRLVTAMYDKGNGLILVSDSHKVVVPGEGWCCGLCNDCNSQDEHIEATDRTPCDSMTSSQNTISQKEANVFGSKVKKTTNIRGLKEVVQQEEANLLDSRSNFSEIHGGKPQDEGHTSISNTPNSVGDDPIKSSIADGNLGEAPESSRRSKRGRILKGTGILLPSKRRRADYGTFRSVDAELPTTSNITTITSEHITIASTDGRNLGEEARHVDATSGSIAHVVEAEVLAAKSVRETEGVLAPSSRVQAPEGSQALTVGLLEPTAVGDFRPEGTVLGLPSLGKLLNVKLSDSDEGLESVTMETDDLAESRASIALTAPKTLKDIVTENSGDQTQPGDTGLILKDKEPLVDKLIAAVSQSEESQVGGLNVQHGPPLYPRPGSGPELIQSIYKDSVTSGASDCRPPGSDGNSGFSTGEVLRKEYCRRVEDNVEVQQRKLDDENFLGFEDAAVEAAAPALRPQEAIPSPGELSHPATNVIFPAKVRDLGRPLEEMEMSSMDLESSEPCQVLCPKAVSTIFEEADLKRLLLEKPCKHSVEQTREKTIATETQPKALDVVDQICDDEHGNYVNTMVNPLSKAAGLDANKNGPQVADPSVEPVSLANPVVPGLLPQVLNSPPLVDMTEVCISKAQANFVPSLPPGFTSQSHGFDVSTPPVTPQFPMPLYQQSEGDGKDLAVSKPLSTRMISVSLASTCSVSSPIVSNPRTLAPISKPLSDDCASPSPSRPQVQIPGAPLCEVDVSLEGLDSQLTKLVSGLPVPPLVTSKESPAPAVVNTIGIVAKPTQEQPSSQLIELRPAFDVSSLSITTDLGRPSLMLDISMSEKVSPEIMVDDSTKVDGGCGQSTDVKESSLEEEEIASVNVLLVEDVKVCDICGNSGYEEALAVCSSCNEGAEHLYCMPTQLDSIPEGWCCETCQARQKAEGPKQTERFLVLSSSFSRSSSMNNRSKPVPIQGSCRSRLSDRLNHKKPRITPVRKSPSKLFSVQTPSKVLANDSLPFPTPKRLAVEGTTCTPPVATVPFLSTQNSFNSVRPVLARDSSFKSGPDTGKVKFLSPSAVANFSPNVRANSGKPSTLVAPTSKPGTTQSGQVSNKSRFASLSSFNESNPASISNKVANQTTQRSTLASAPTPALSRGLVSGKSAAELPSFLMNSNSRQGNMLKTLGQSKSSREGGVADGVSALCQGREAFTPGQTSGSRLSGSMSPKLGKSASSSALPIDLRPWPDTPRPSVDDRKGLQRAPYSSEPTPPGAEAPTDSQQGGVSKGKQPAKVAQLGPLSSFSNWQSQLVCRNQNLKHLGDVPNPDQSSPGKSKEQSVSPTLAESPVGMEVIPLSDVKTAVIEIAPGTSGLNSGTGCVAEVTNVTITEVLSKPQRSLGGGTEVRQVSVDSASLVGSRGLQSGTENMVRSAPWLAATSNTRCYKCKEVGHSAPDCPKRNSSLTKHLEQKVTESGTSVTSVGLNTPDLSKPNSSFSSLSEQKIDEWRTSSTNVSPSAPVTSKESIPKFRDIDAHVPVVGMANLGSVEIEHLGATPDGFVESVAKIEKEVAETQPADADIPTTLTSSPTSINLPYKNPVSFKIQNSKAPSKLSPLVSSSSIRRLVAGHASHGHSAQTNGNISTGTQTQLQKSNASSSDASEGPPGVCNPTDSIPKDSKSFSIDPTNYPASSSPTIFYPPNLSQGHVLQPTDLSVLPALPPKALSNRGIPPPWVPSPPWMDGPGQGAPGLVGYPPPGALFPPGPVGYTPPGPMPYLVSPPPLPLLPPQFISPTAPPPELATPNDTIAWRGAFEVADGQNTTLYDAIQAHTSTKAVSKVHEVARGMPQRLQLEQVARSLELETWPRQFNQRPPTDGSIALYFFATNGESFNRFLRNLVENMVTHDLVLRAQVDDAELLIFPSSKLPERFQRWMGHFFLWGVFRAKKQAAGPKATGLSTEVLVEINPGTVRGVPSSAGQITKTLPCGSPIPGSASTGEVDMEVDMEGGRDCGIADKAVKRPESTLLAPTTVASPAPTVESITSPVTQQLAMLETDPIEGKSKQVADEDLDLPPGFAPASKKSAPVSNLPPGFEKKIEALKQELLKSLESGGSLSLPSTTKVGSGNSADAETPDSGISFQTRNLTSAEKVKSGNRQPSPLAAPCPRETDVSLPAARPSTAKRSSSISPTQPKVKDREEVRERPKERIRDREKGSRDTERAQGKSRDQNRDYYRDRTRERDRSRERDRLCDHESSKERVRSRDKDRDRDRERDRERRRLPEREKPKDRRSKEGDCDRDRDRRPSYKRSRSQSRSRSQGRQRAQSRSPPRRGRSRSPPRRYPSYRRQSISGSDSPDSRSRDFSRGALIDESRSRRAENGSHAGNRRSILEKDVGDKCSRPTSRLKTHTVSDIIEDTRSDSAGASNSRTVADAEPTKAVAISRSITPVLDMNEGVSRGGSGEGALASTSLPDLNTQNESVESGVPFHDFLPADVGGPPSELETASSIAEQTFFPGARPTVTPNPTVIENMTGRGRPELSTAMERWNFAVASSSSRPEFGSRLSAGYQFMQTSEMDPDGKVFSNLHTNPDLELALGGRERSPSPSEPLPLLVRLLDGPGMHAHSASPELGFGFYGKDRANSPDLRVGLSTSNSRGSDTASLSLSLAVPPYRKEGNSWVKVEDERGTLGMDDVDFALTL